MMPTGYTHKIYAGEPITLGEYLRDVARMYGFAMHMRDDSPDTPLRRREEDNYSAKSRERAAAEMARYRNMSVEEALEEIAAFNAEQAKRHAEETERVTAMAERYDRMIDAVEAWEAPAVLSTDPPGEGWKEGGFKAAALEHLRYARGGDVLDPSDYYKPFTAGPAMWISEHFTAADRMYRMHVEDAEKHERNIEATNIIIDAILESTKDL